MNATESAGRPIKDQPTRPSHRTKRLVVVLSAVGVAAFIQSNHKDYPAFRAALHGASPAWLVAAVVSAVLGVVLGSANAHRSAISAAGSAIPFRAGVALGLRSYAMNTVVKSGGLAGMVPYLRYTESTGASRSKTRTGYLLANVFGDVAVAGSLVVALVVLTVSRRLSVAVLAASAVFGLYLATIVAAIIAAARSRETVRRLHDAPRRMLARLRGRGAVQGDFTAADEMFEAIRRLRSDPASMLPALGWSLLVDVAGAVSLWAVLHAFGEPAGVVVVVSAYGVSMLFALIGFLPGGLGFAEISLAGVLIGSGISVPVAAAIAVTDRVIEAWLPSALGLLIQVPYRTRADHIDFNATKRVRGVRRSTGAAVLVLGGVELWLAATRHPILDSAAVMLDPRTGALRDSRYLLLACGLALLISVRGLARGSRHAWIVALAAIGASGVLHPVGRGDLLGTIVAVAAATALILGKSSFTAHTDPRSSKAAVTWLAGGGAMVVGYGTVGLFFMDTEIGEGSTFIGSFDNALRLLFVLPSTTLRPLTRHAIWFIDSVRVLAVAVFVSGVTMLVRPVLDKVRSRRGERERVLAILEEWGSTALAHFHLLPDKSFVWSADVAAFVGYRRVGAVAVALGEPVGRPSSQSGAAYAFLALCDANGWTPAFHQVTPQGAAILESVGLQRLKIGEEATIDLDRFTLEGKHFKRLRTQLRQLTNDGIVVEELHCPIGDETMHELRSVSDIWVGDRGHRERTFTLGAFDEDQLRHDRILVARSNHRIEAFVNLVPSYNARLGNFDLMRRRPDAPNGVMDLLLVRMAEMFRREGCTGMSLGLAPLTNIEGRTLAARVLRVMAERDSKAFNFNGLRAYKEKWRPEWEPRFLMFASELSLARIGYAVARVGELRPNIPLLLRIGLADVPPFASVVEARLARAEAEDAAHLQDEAGCLGHECELTQADVT